MLHLYKCIKNIMLVARLLIEAMSRMGMACVFDVC